MTLIECFTKAHVDNISACLRLEPDQMIMVGSGEDMKTSVKRYRGLLAQRGLNTQITLCDVGNMHFEEIVAAVDGFVREDKDCVIDLTGGDEVVILAMGAVLAGLDSKKRKSVRVEKFDHNLDAVQNCTDDDCGPFDSPVTLTVEELLYLHGGKLLPNANQPDVDDIAAELEAMWRIASADPKKWNSNIGMLNKIESRLESRMEIYRSLESLRGISDFAEKENDILDLLEAFHYQGIVENRSNRYALSYMYQSPTLCECTQKAGNILEIKTLLEGRSVMENGEPFFQDCRMSVGIDWDGVLDDSEELPETRNEIDVVLMHGTTPLFISCKNGGIGEEELYKLHTVATHFGDPYARKMLIATELNQKSEKANRALIQRAEDMGIFLVPDAAKLSKEKWKQIFKQAML